MRSIAVITPSDARFREYVASLGRITSVNRNRAIGDGWIAHHVHSAGYVPAGQKLTEIVVLDGYGDTAVLAELFQACLVQMDAYTMPVAA